MTAPNGPILFNSSTGSDTQASGLGPAAAVFGSGASTTNGSAVVTGIDTTGVSAGHLLWVLSSSGRQFSIIASVDSGTQVTCDNTFANTETGRTWAIGGKRATFENVNSRTLFTTAGAIGGWTIQTETNQTIDTNITIAMNQATSPVVIKGDSTSSRRIITQTTNTRHFAATTSVGLVRFENLTFVNTAGSKTAADVWQSSSNIAGLVCFENCILGDAINTVRHGLSQTNGGIRFVFRNSVIKNTTSIGIVNFPPVEVYNSSVTNCGSDGWKPNNNNSYLIASNSIFSNNAGNGVDFGVNTGVGFSLKNCIFTGNTADGLSASSGNGKDLAIVSQCVFASNGGYGIDWDSTIPCSNIDRNAFFNNTAGHRNVIPAGPNDITLTADPFVDASAGDFNINNDAGGGATLRGVTVTL